MANKNAAAKEAPTHADVQPAGDSGSNNHGIKGAAQEAWSGLGRWTHKAAEKAKDVGSAALDAGQDIYHKGKEAVKSEQGQKIIKQTRQGAADAVDAVGGNSNNRTVNEVVRNAKIIPGAGNVLSAAETLSNSGVTDVMRDGKGKVNKDVLIRGAVEVAPVSGDAARLKHLADRTGVTDKVVRAVQDQVQKPKTQEQPADPNKAHEVQPRVKAKR
jgi:hypothetical protein